MRTNPNLQARFRVGVSIGYGLFSLLVIIVGVSYLPIVTQPDKLPDGLKFSTNLFPIWVWGSVWCIAGLIGVVAAALQLQRHWFRWAVTAQVVMHALWGTFYAIGWSGYAFGGSATGGRDYLSARSYLGAAVLLVVLTACVSALRPVPINKDGL